VNLIPLLNTALLVLLFVGVAACLHKIRRIHLMAYRIQEDAARARTESHALFGQLSALASLDRCLRLDGAIPSMRGWAASPDFLLAITEEFRERKPERVIEYSSGTSTVVIAKCLELCRRGPAYSLEHDPDYAEATRTQLKRYGLERWATVVDAPLERTPRFESPWYSLSALPNEAREIDLLVIDGPPGTTGPLARYPALPRLNERLARTCSVLLDDADRDSERRALALWNEAFPEFLQQRLYCEKGAARLRRGAPILSETAPTAELTAAPLATTE